MGEGGGVYTMCLCLNLIMCACIVVGDALDLYWFQICSLKQKPAVIVDPIMVINWVDSGEMWTLISRATFAVTYNIYHIISLSFFLLQEKGIHTIQLCEEEV